MTGIASVAAADRCGSPSSRKETLLHLRRHGERLPRLLRIELRAHAIERHVQLADVLRARAAALVDPIDAHNFERIESADERDHRRRRRALANRVAKEASRDVEPLQLLAR